MRSSLKLVDCIVEVQDAAYPLVVVIPEFIIGNVYLAFVPAPGTEF